MTIRDAMDILSPSCQIRTQSLKILRRDGMEASLRYLVQYVKDDEYNRQLIVRLRQMQTRDWNHVIDVCIKE